MELELQSCYLDPGLEKLDRDMLEHNMIDDRESCCKAEAICSYLH